MEAEKFHLSAPVKILIAIQAAVLLAVAAALPFAVKAWPNAFIIAGCGGAY